MAGDERRDCPRCGAARSASIIYERFGTLTWWCVACDHDWQTASESLAIGATQRDEAVASLSHAALKRSAA